MASPACGLTPQQRAAAMSWLLATARTSNPVISDATVFLAADYFDRYLAHRANAAACRPPGAPLPPLPGLKLLAATCLWVAGKYEEVHPPSAQVLLALVEKDAAAVTALPPGTPSLSAAMVSLEAALLTGLDFQLNPPTCLSFAHALLSQTCASLPAELHAALNRRVSTVLCAGLSSWDAAWQYLPSTVAGAAVVLCHAELGWSAGGSGSGQAQIQALLGPRCGDTLPAAMLVLCGALQAGNPSSSPSLCGSLCSGSGSSSFMAYGGSQQHFVPVLGGFHCHSPVPGASNSQASSCDACYQQLTLSRTMSAPEHNLVAQYADACMSDADCCCSSQQSSGGSVPLPPLSSAAHVMGYGSGSDDSSADLLMLSAHLNGRLAAAAAAPQGAAPAVGGFTLLPPVAAVKPPPTQAQRRWSSLLPRRGSFRSAVNNLDSLREEEMEEAIAAAASAPLSAYVIGSGGSADDSGCWLGSGLVGEDDWSDSILLDGCDGAAAAADADGQWGRH